MVKRRPKPEVIRDDARSRILSAFSERAKRSGIRAVSMADLAATLRMSMTTVYGQFPSKEALVEAMVDEWCDDLATHDALSRDARKPIRERFLLWGEAWSARVLQYMPPFWADLAGDYPVLWRRLQADLDERKAIGAAVLRPYLKPGLVPEAAFALLELIYTRAADPRLCDRLGVARKDVLRDALRIWAEGSLRK